MIKYEYSNADMNLSFYPTVTTSPENNDKIFAIIEDEIKKMKESVVRRIHDIGVTGNYTFDISDYISASFVPDVSVDIGNATLQIVAPDTFNKVGHLPRWFVDSMLATKVEDFEKNVRRTLFCNGVSSGVFTVYLFVDGVGVKKTTIDAAETLENVAKKVYMQWEPHPNYVPWVENGNSYNQENARLTAQTLQSLQFNANGHVLPDHLFE